MTTDLSTDARTPVPDRPGQPGQPDRPAGPGAVPAAALDALRAASGGPVLVPGDDGYVAESTMWNLAFRHHPAVVVGATSAADVQAAVRFAAGLGLPVGVAATGHGAAAPMDGAVLVSTRRMSGVQVFPGDRVVRIEAGARWQDVLDATTPYGLAPLAGSSPGVGAVGYTLGGGLSPALGRRYGWAADHVLALEVVGADGSLSRVDAASDPELFWALRGGRGNFGVVTAIEARVFDVPDLFGGGLFVDAEHTRDVLRAWYALASSAPDELSTSVAFLRLPALPAVPEVLRDRFVLHVRIAYSGDPAEGARLVAPLRAVGGALLDTLGVLPFAQVGAIHADPVDPVPALERTRALRRLSWPALEALLDVAGPGRRTAAHVVEVRLLGGALARAPRVASAVGGREAQGTLFAAVMAPPEAASAVEPDLIEVVDALGPWTAAGTLPNFTTPADARPDAFRRAYDDLTYARLALVKRRVDPRNLFRAGTNIPPAKDADVTADR